MSKVILEKFCSTNLSQLPENFQHFDLKSFGIDISLYEYQQQALQNILSCIFQYYQDGIGFYSKYLNNGLTEEILKQINITKKDEHDEVFNILSQYYTSTNDTIEFKQLINRASFWMATGSGKTLVMIKLIELLFELSKLPKELGGIPANDILLLAPKETILTEH